MSMKDVWSGFKLGWEERVSNPLWFTYLWVHCVKYMNEIAVLLFNDSIVWAERWSDFYKTVIVFDWKVAGYSLIIVVLARYLKIVPLLSQRLYDYFISKIGIESETISKLRKDLESREDAFDLQKEKLRDAVRIRDSLIDDKALIDKEHAKALKEKLKVESELEETKQGLENYKNINLKDSEKNKDSRLRLEDKIKELEEKNKGLEGVVDSFRTQINNYQSSNKNFVNFTKVEGEINEKIDSVYGDLIRMLDSHDFNAEHKQFIQFIAIKVDGLKQIVKFKNSKATHSNLTVF